jgi:hypothetical protein
MRLFRAFGFDSRRHGFSVGALVAMLVFGVGAVVHLEHHLLDPGCESGAGGESHPCVSCTSLHGSALVEESPVAEPWRLASFIETAPAAETAPPRRAWVSSAPRAPPLS